MIVVTTNQIKKLFAEFGYSLPVDYIYLKNNITTKIKTTCPLGHDYYVSAHSFINHGRRCKTCSVNKKRLKNSEVKNILESNGYQLLDIYQHCQKPLKVLCPKNHLITITINSFKNGHRCIQCNSSRFHKEARNGKAFTCINSRFYQYKIEIDQQWLKRKADELEGFYQNCPKNYCVDHIVPLCWFNLSDLDQCNWAWCKGNLRYLSVDNNSKRSYKSLGFLELWELIDQFPGIWQVILAAKNCPVAVRNETIAYIKGDQSWR